MTITSQQETSAGAMRPELAHPAPGATRPAVVEPASSAHASLVRDARTRWARLATYGAAPLLVALDVAAVVIGTAGTESLARVALAEDSPTRKVAFFGLVLVVCFWNAGLYRPRLSLSLLNDLPAILGRWLAAVAIAVLAQVVWSGAVWDDYIINWQFLWGALAIQVLALVGRGLGYAFIRRMRTRRLVEHRTLVLGAGRVGIQVADILAAHREYGLHPIGFLDEDPFFEGIAHELPVLGGPDQIGPLLTTYNVHNVVVAFSGVKESQMVSLIRTCDRFKCELFVVPRLFELHHSDGVTDTAWGLPLVRLRRSTYRSRSWQIKRLFDLSVAAVSIFLIAPLLLVLAIGVRLDGGPGILFRQQRVGVDGRPFELLKFRSLRPVDDDEARTHWNIAHDDRVSTFGRFLRKTSLDELPQLVNILRGEMSLVGPRPERPHFVDQFRATHPSYEARHRVPSGLTGWAQVHGLRGDTSIADRARFDNYYIENWSLWLDIKILARTVSSVLGGSGG